MDYSRIRYTVEEIERIDSLRRAREANCNRTIGHVYTRYPAEIGCSSEQQHCINCGKIER